MKVKVTDFDSEFLKVIIASKLSGKSIEVELLTEDSINDASKFPCLILDCGKSIEGGNEICLFLFSDSYSESVNTWLQWDFSELSNAVSSYTSSCFNNSEFNTFLNKLNSCLSTKFLCDSLSSADICIWCTLYPLHSDDSCKQIFSSYCNLESWISNLEATFKVSELNFDLKKGLCAIPKSFPDDNVESLSKQSCQEAILIWENINVNAHEAVMTWTKPVLPAKDKKNILITSALPYVNNVPHLGNIIGCVLSADVFARYCRLRNWNTLYICGTDEYGTAIETKALEEGLTPLEIANKYFLIHSEIYSWFNIKFDHFGRTTSTHQKEVVQEVFKACHKNGFTTIETVDQLLCENCDRYLADRFVEGICPRCKYEDARGDQCDGCGHLINAIELIEPRCKVCRNRPVVKQSQQLFLSLPDIEPDLAKWVDKISAGWSHNARVITKSWLREGLRPRCITRDLKWGIPVPLEGFSSKVFYVWFDAPIGYMSITKSYCDEWEKWWEPENDVQLYQFMAKDNVPFHSIMFPATIMASKRPFKLVDHLMAVEYLNYEDGKFSKSRGVGVFGNDAKDTGIPSDVFRFYLLYIRPESQDTNFSWSDLATKNNTELLNNLGNFILRTLTFSVKFFNSKVPKITLTDEEKSLVAIITTELLNYIGVILKGRLKEGIKFILNISRLGNQYIQSNQPWVLVKGTDTEKERAATVVSFACNMVGLLSVLLEPFMPDTSRIIREQTNFPAEHFILSDKFIPYFLPDHEIGKPTPLFTKIEEATVESLKLKYSGKQSTELSKDNIIPDFSNLSVECLEEEITKQGEIVRQLKAGGAEKALIQSEVKKLLELKNNLALTKGEPVEVTKKDKKKKK